MADGDENTGANIMLNVVNDGGTASTIRDNWYTYRTMWTVDTPHVSIEGQTTKKPTNGINPRLYFKFVKSKLKALELRAFKSRLEQLEKLAEKYASMKQEALSDECVRQFYVISRESAMYACGIKVFVTKEDLDRFRYKIAGDLKITPIKNFVRIIPDKAAEKIKKCIDRQLFDDFVIVHLDLKEQPATAMTRKEKIEREKDPICFGRINESEKYYFVADWIDELDDLRLEDIVKKLSLKKEDMTINKKLTLSDLEGKEKENGTEPATDSKA